MNISDEGEKTGPVEHMAISLLLGVLAAHLIAGQFIVTTSTIYVMKKYSKISEW